MNWWTRQQFGGILLLCLVGMYVKASFSNETIVQEIPSFYANLTEGNVLLHSLLKDCKNPSFPCIQNTMYRYLNGILSTDDSEIGGFIKFSKNNISYEMQEREEEDKIVARRSTPLEEVTSSLAKKAYKYMLTHNMQLRMPDTLFDGAIFQVSPRHFEDNGLVAKLEFIPKKTQVASPRIFFKKIKKIIGEKLMNALLALLLIISMVSVKFMFFTPMVMGVAAAKKLLLKLLLFFFPFLAHLFKLCPYYDNHSLTKFHHHHHQIAHLHHLTPHIKHYPEIHDHPPPYAHEPDHHYEGGGLDYYSEGPGFTNDFITHRKTDEKSAEENDINTWFGSQSKETIRHQRKPPTNRPLTAVEIENLALKAEKEAVLKVRLQQEHQRVQAENKLLQDQIQHGLKLQEKLRLQASSMQQRKRINNQISKTPLVLQANLPPKASPVYQPLSVTQMKPFGPSFHSMAPLTKNANIQFSKALSIQHRQDNHKDIPTSQTEKQPFMESSNVNAPVYDEFYSPILEKIDKILIGIGFIDEPCKERLICSMYKNPTKFSPHSNLVSAHLSRDASELQKPSTTNSAVIRFYRYVQAARDGQDKRECLRLYPSCSINTEA